MVTAMSSFSVIVSPNCGLSFLLTYQNLLNLYFKQTKHKYILHSLPYDYDRFCGEYSASFVLLDVEMMV